jgi:transcription antitermination protein NusB
MSPYAILYTQYYILVLFMASRHLSRIAALQALFASDVRGDFSFASLTATWENNTDSLAHEDEDRAFTESLLKGVSAKQREIDEVIAGAAPQWPIEKIAIIDRNLLRLGLFELLYGSSISVPPKVALNEAIELAKTFGGNSSPKFINGVMGAVYRDMGTPRKDESPKSHTTPAPSHAAGAVVCAKEKDTWYVALILDAFNTWTLPKSRLGSNELSQAAALRAIQEELGIEAPHMHGPLGEHTYTTHEPGASAATRTALYFLACAKKEVLAPQEKESVQRAEWFTQNTLPEGNFYEDLRNLIESGIQRAIQECVHD